MHCLGIKKSFWAIVNAFSLSLKEHLDAIVNKRRLSIVGFYSKINISTLVRTTEQTREGPIGKLTLVPKKLKMTNFCFFSEPTKEGS